MRFAPPFLLLLLGCTSLTGFRDFQGQLDAGDDTGVGDGGHDAGDTGLDAGEDAGADGGYDAGYDAGPRDECDAVFGVVCDDFEDGYLKAINGDLEDTFGIAVAIDGDVAVVGAYHEDSLGQREDNSVSDAGAAYVFRRVGGRWTFEAYLKAPQSSESDEFGYPVAISGDLVAVGSHLEDSGDRTSPDETAENAGAVHLYRRVSGTWRYEAYVKARVPTAGDSFGWRVALEGERLAVGADRTDYSGPGLDPPPGEPKMDSGSVTIFQPDEFGLWQPVAILEPDDSEAGDQFGYSLSLDGDRIAVGSYNEPGDPAFGPDDRSMSGAGAVYIFELSDDGIWAQVARLKASNGGEGDHFGSAVAIDGPLLVVGAAREDGSGEGVNPPSNDAADESGAVYVFREFGPGDWRQEAYIKPAYGRGELYFGWSVDVVGERIAIGAPYDPAISRGLNGNPRDDRSPTSGAAYLFVHEEDAWRQEAYIKPRFLDTGDFFGLWVALDTDTLIAGSPRDDSGSRVVDGDSGDNSASNQGAAYVFRLRP